MAAFCYRQAPHISIVIYTECDLYIGAGWLSSQRIAKICYQTSISTMKKSQDFVVRIELMQIMRSLNE